MLKLGFKVDVVGKRHSLQAFPKELSQEREASWKEWLQQYRTALKEEGMEESERLHMQNSVNPCYIPRNHLLQEVIAEAEKGNHRAVRSPREPYSLNPNTLRPFELEQPAEAANF